MKRLEPIPAGIAVDRRAPIKSSRSTIATMADLEPYLSALFLREARPVCPEHGFEAREFDVSSAARSAAESLGGARAVVTYPVRVTGTEAYLEVREGLLKDGYRRAWLAGKTCELDAIKPSQVLESGALEVIVDRVGGGKRRKKAGSRHRNGLVARRRPGAHPQRWCPPSVEARVGLPPSAAGSFRPRAPPVLV